MIHFHRQCFHFDTRGHRTGVHTDETSNRSRAPGPPYNSGESRESTFVQRERGGGANLGMRAPRFANHC